MKSLFVHLLTHRSQKLKSLHQQMEAYVVETNRERQKLEQEKADIKEKEKKMRKSLQAEFDKKEEEQREEFKKMQEELQRKVDILQAERRDWEEEKVRLKQTRVFEKVVTLDVGGTKYRTTLSTLTKYPDSMLGAMFSGRHDLPQQEDGSYFIDRDGEVFKYILMYLRDRDTCFDVLYDRSLCDSRVPSSLPSPLEKPLLKQIASEAEYFQFGELQTKVQIILCGTRAYSGIVSVFETYLRGHLSYTCGLDYDFHPKPQCYELDYGQCNLQCNQYSKKSEFFKHRIINRVEESDERQTGVEFTENITFDSCDLSGTHFRNCYFQKGVSFKGCILRGAKFERVGGLVRHKVHFAPWQVAQADFEPELLQALKDNGCIY